MGFFPHFSGGVLLVILLFKTDSKCSAEMLSSVPTLNKVVMGFTENICMLHKPC